MRVSLLIVAGLVAAVAAAVAQDFAGIDNAFLCMRSDFVEAHSEAISERHCALLCNERGRCRAFSLVDGPCQLFMFDKCSKYVRDCSCSRRGRLFMKKKQAELPPGAGLCPSGFANDFCGTKYKLFGGVSSWDQAKSTIEGQPGLVIMADLVDKSESQYVSSLLTIKGWSLVLLGGYQPAGSPEPAGGWVWSSCGTSVIMNSSVWQNGEPNNFGSGENLALLGIGSPQINDDVFSGSITGALAECVSPFD